MSRRFIEDRTSNGEKVIEVYRGETLQGFIRKVNRTGKYSYFRMDGVSVSMQAQDDDLESLKMKLLNG